MTPVRSRDPNAGPAFGSPATGHPAAGAGPGAAGDWGRARAAAPAQGRPREAAEAPAYWARAARADLQAAPAAESAPPAVERDLCPDWRRRHEDGALGSRHSLQDHEGPRALNGRKVLDLPETPLWPPCSQAKVWPSALLWAQSEGGGKTSECRRGRVRLHTPEKKSAGPLARPGKYRRRAANLPEGNSCCTAQGASSAKTQCPHLRHNAMRNDRMSGMTPTLSSVQCKTRKSGHADTNQ